MPDPQSLTQPPLLPRELLPRVQRALETFPVVAIVGARQTGKSTLVRDLLQQDDRLYVTLDDIETAELAEREPDALLRRAGHMTIDEVQRAPDLLLAIKRAVDRERTPGRFILTGSANLLLMQQVSESLAGRALYLTLWPMTRREQLAMPTPGRWDTFFETDPGDWPAALKQLSAPSADWGTLARRGGYPVPACHLVEGRSRRDWFRAYIDTYLERDVRQLASIEYLVDYRRLMRAVSLRTGNLMNQADLARDVALAPSTAQRYLNLMEVSYQLVRLESYSVSRTKRLTKSPKAYWSDTGLSLEVAGEAEPRGAHLENLVFTDLLAWRDYGERRAQILYWRTTKGAEVDFVIEHDADILPVEVKSSNRVGLGDAKNLRVFLDEYSRRAKGGLLLYDGDEVFWLTDRILVVPWWRVV
jgi:predicted AAA+ superfamily ATPase